MYGNLGMVQFEEINQAPPSSQCCSILEELQHRCLRQETVSDIANDIDNRGSEVDLRIYVKH